LPEFNADVYEYLVYITEYDKLKDITFNLNFEAADINAAAEEKLEEDDEYTVKTITLKGNENEKSEYIIKFRVIKKTELLIKDNIYVINNDFDIKDLPDGFEKEKVTIDSEEVYIAKSQDGNVELAQFVKKSNGKNAKWYVYDSKNTNFIASKIIKIDDKKYVLMSKDGNLVYGEGDEGFGFYSYEKSANKLGFFVGKGIADKEEGMFSFNINPVILLAIALVMAVAGILFVKKKNSKDTNNDKKYFRPYLSLDDNDDNDDM